jgi:hypothetical protein
MKIAKHLTTAANSTSALYRIVFTALLLFELVRFRWRKNAQGNPDHNRGRRY